MAFLEYRPIQTLYQFCSVDSFRAILKSKSLWCSDLASANDPRELKLGFVEFMAALRYVRTNEYEGSVGDFLDRIAGLLVRYKDQQQTFCACFSLLKDELPMWREYGNNYSGLAIGFRPTAITSMPGRIQKVKYVSDDTMEDFREIVREIASAYDPNHSAGDAGYWITAHTTAFASITALKHRSWSYEQEVRFIHAQTREAGELHFPRADLPDGTPVYWQKPLSRELAGIALEYKVFPFGRFKNQAYDPSGAIERIILGPHCALSAIEVTSELEANGFKNFQVAPSDCEIR